jgi:SAM-dependent methyltransferase
VSLRSNWDAEAAAWIRWAREPDQDHYFWRLNLPTLLELLPPPGRLTVDVGCGEGRVARELIARGHRVVGIEGSPALAAAAREAGPAFEVHVADAAAMPLPDGCADLAVASMSMLNFDDMPGVVREVARVLAPGGRFVFNVPHPSSDGVEDYFETTTFAETRDRGGLRMTFHDTHRPLSAYTGALEAAGLVVEALREPRPSAEHVAAHPSAERYLREPGFLLIRARTP